MTGSSLKLLIWNIEWAKAESERGRCIGGVVDVISPDVICLTEATAAMVPEDGYLIESDPDYGYPNDGKRRKVILWSKNPWTDVDSAGCEGLPGGRFVTGVSCGVRFVGVCIPWKDAHVRTGRKDRNPWQDHLAYLNGLEGLLRGYCEDATPVCVLGDFNQRIPQKWQPVEVFERLTDVLSNEFEMETAGLVDEEGKQLIDHVAVSQGLKIEVQYILPKNSPDGLRLSDHSGIVTKLMIA